MATAITHAIVAGALGTLAPGDLPRVRLGFVLAVLSTMPDLDVIGFHFGIAYGDALGHRGFTHSILFAAIAALITPAIAFRGTPAFSRAWWNLVCLAFIATASHGVLDSFTDAGLGIGFFIPFDDTRYFAPWRPLETSPLSISAFLNGPAATILANELKWIGIPFFVLLGIGHWIRALRKRR